MEILRCTCCGTFFDGDKNRFCPRCGYSDTTAESIPEKFREYGNHRELFHKVDIKKCTCCGTFFDGDKNRFCPRCGYSDMTAESILEKFREYGESREIYRKKDCTVLTVGEEHVLKILSGEKTAAGLLEAKTLSLLRECPELVKLEDFGTEQNSFYILESKHTTLSEYIRSRPIYLKDIWNIARDICSALIYCKNHGYYHLDVHPNNIYVNEEGRALLGDFGNAQEVKHADMTLLKEVAPRYIHPDYYLNKGGCITEQWDLFGLCMVVYGLLSEGVLPYMGLSAGLAAERISKGDIAIPGDDQLSPLVIRGLKGEVNSQEQFLETLESIKSECSEALPEKEKTAGLLFGLFSRKKVKQEEKPSSSGNPASRIYSYPEKTQQNNSLFDAEDSGTYNGAARKPGAGQKPGIENIGLSQMPFDDGGADGTVPVSWEETEFSTPAADGMHMYPQAFCPESMPAFPKVFDADPEAWTAPISLEDAGNPLPFVVDTPAAYPKPMFSESSFMPPVSFDADPFAATCASSGEEPGTPVLSEVYFSAVCEKNAQKDSTLVIDVVMYEKAFREEVDRLLSELENGQEKRSGMLKAALGTLVTVELSSQDIEVEDNRCEMTWEGEYLDFSFFAEIPEEFARHQVRFTASVFFDGIPATRLKFMVDCRSSGHEKLEFTREDIRSAYISYASQDRARVVGLIQGMQSIRPDLDLFFDVDSLRTGESWETALYREIEQRSYLFLCWSSNALKSPWVEKEWKYALQTKGEDSILPIPLEPPEFCPPPHELERKHFNNRLLYLIQSGLL